MNSLRVALIQSRCHIDPEQNLKNAVAKIRQAASLGARLICLQELFRTPYFCREEQTSNFDLAEPVPGPTTTELAALCKTLKITLLAPIFERRTAGIYHNTALLIDTDGRVVGQYRKMHIPDDPGYHEKFYFTPGDLGFESHQSSCAKIGTLICWDQWFPEAARLSALSGAEILCFPTAIGWHQDTPDETKETEHEAWEIVQRAHAVANGVFVLSVNRVGLEGSLQFWGQSFVADPLGRILAKASRDDEEVLLANCDLDLVEKTRQAWPFLRDRRTDAYQGLSKRFLDGDPE